MRRTSQARVHAVVPLIAVLLTGCAQRTADTAAPAATSSSPSSPAPYAGPIDVPGDPDATSLAGRAGSALGALKCDGRPDNGGGGGYDTGLSTVQETPVAALENYLQEEPFQQVPSSGYRAEIEQAARVLFSYDVGGRTKVALVVADGTADVEGSTGCGVVSWARCDASELPDDVTEALGVGVWTDEHGARVPVATISSRQGPAHCGWEDITFLSVGSGRTADLYLRDTSGELQAYLATTFAADAQLPEDAADTGYRRNGRVLWLAADGRAAYLVGETDPQDVERWPAAQPIGCA